MDLNRAMIIGRLTRDPEIRSLPSGKSVASVTVATGRVWTDKEGQKQKESEFHNVVLWGRLAEIAGQYLHKAARVYMDGRIQTRDWTGQDGVKRYRTEMIAENMIMLEGPSGGGNYQSASPVSPSNPAEPTPADGVVEEEVRVEDIPF